MAAQAPPKRPPAGGQKPPARPSGPGQPKKAPEGSSSEAKDSDPLARIEETALSIGSVASVKENSLMRRFITELAPKLTVRGNTTKLLDAFSRGDVKSENVGQILKDNLYYQHYMLAHIESISKRTEFPDISSAVILLGMQKSRDLLLALQLVRSLTDAHPGMSKEGKLELNVAETLKYALKSEEALTGNKDGYVEFAYAGGLVFDYLKKAAEVLANDPKAVDPVIEQVFRHGLRSARCGMEVCNSLSSFGFKKYVFGACLIHDVGKICMTILDPSYAVFLDECMKKEVPRHVRYHAEKKRFGVTHEVFSSLLCQFFSPFRTVSTSVLFHHNPQNYVGGDQKVAELAQLLHLSSNMANHLKKPEKADDPLYHYWKGHEAKDFKVSNEAMVSAVEKALAHAG